MKIIFTNRNKSYLKFHLLKNTQVKVKMNLLKEYHQIFTYSKKFNKAVWDIKNKKESETLLIKIRRVNKTNYMYLLIKSNYLKFLKRM